MPEMLGWAFPRSGLRMISHSTWAGGRNLGHGSFPSSRVWGLHAGRGPGILLHAWFFSDMGCNPKVRATPSIRPDSFTRTCQISGDQGLEHPFNQDPSNQDSFNQDPFNQDLFNQDPAESLMSSFSYDGASGQLHPVLKQSWLKLS